MLLVDSHAQVNEIMLDILNPRLGKKMDCSQTELAEELLNDKKAKELLTSMKAGLSWVNRIVIVPIEQLSEKEREIYGEDLLLNYKYIAVEGNTRLACLLHDSMKEVLQKNEYIPVLIVKGLKMKVTKNF